MHDIEVIVADAHSTDQTRELAAEGGARVVDGGMPAVGRNAGARAATGNVIVFLDSDVRIPKNFLQNAITEFNERGLAAATAEARPASDLAIDRLIHRFANLFVRLNQETEPHAPGYCILARRSVVEAIGGFNEQIKVAEDHDFVRRAAKHGPFRMLNTAWFFVDVRRYEKEGRIAYSLKAARVTAYRYLHGEITDESVVEYEFGDYTARDKTTAQKALRAIEEGIISIDRRTQELQDKLEEALRKGSAATEEYQEKLEEFGEMIKDAGRALFGPRDDRPDAGDAGPDARDAGPTDRSDSPGGA
jgi:glycosyltransferase involved in cell wall biosynthesis